MTKVTFSEKQANTYHGGGMYVAVETNMGTVEGRLGEKWLSPLSGCFDFNWGGATIPASEALRQQEARRGLYQWVQDLKVKKDVARAILAGDVPAGILNSGHVPTIETYVQREIIFARDRHNARRIRR